MNTSLEFNVESGTGGNLDSARRRKEESGFVGLGITLPRMLILLSSCIVDKHKDALYFKHR